LGMSQNVNIDFIVPATSCNIYKQVKAQPYENNLAILSITYIA
jgi:hypothetical protein